MDFQPETVLKKRLFKNANLPNTTWILKICQRSTNFKDFNATFSDIDHTQAAFKHARPSAEGGGGSKCYLETYRMSCQRGLQSYEIYFNHQLCTPLLHGRTIKLSEKYPNSTWNPLVSDFILIILIAAVQVQPDVGNNEQKLKKKNSENKG